MLRWCTVTSASIFVPKSVSWAKYWFIARNCALKSWNASQLAPEQGIWKIEIRTSAKSRKCLAKYFFFKFNNLPLFGLETLKRSRWKGIGIFFRKRLKNTASMSNKKCKHFSGEKRIWHSLFHGLMNANMSILANTLFDQKSYTQTAWA